ncbi:MAG: hypothetical protein HUJ68_04430 [Clostridia bacterium]|nr:hypothetical protein [Clostridia bacterium]
MVNKTVLTYTIFILAIIILTDAIISIIKVKNIKGRLEYIEKLNNEIKEKLKDIKQMAIEKEKGIKTKKTQDIIEKLKRKRNRTILKLYKNVYRLKRAFPAISTKEITEILNKKIEIKKKNKKSIDKDI